MSPGKMFQEFGDLKKTINSGWNPSPLGINTNSQAIRKPITKHIQPVIIYTYSSKIIRTHPRDFMALVQKLTGLSPSQESDSSSVTTDEKVCGANDDDYAKESSSVNKMANSNDLSCLGQPSFNYIS